MLILIYIYISEVTSGTGDPHFMVSSLVSDDKFCYDVHGYENQTMLLVKDEDLGRKHLIMCLSFIYLCNSEAYVTKCSVSQS